MRQLFVSAILLTATCLPTAAHASLVLDLSSGSGTLGALLNGASSGTFAVPGGGGLTITVVSVTGGGTPTLDANGSHMGINSTGGGGDSNNFFDFDLSESATFSFNQAVDIVAVSIQQLTSGESMEFAGQTLTSASLVGDTADFSSSPISLAANTSFSVAMNAGAAGLKSITLAAVPEPTGFLFGTLLSGVVGTCVARRRKRVAV